MKRLTMAALAALLLGSAPPALAQGALGSQLQSCLAIFGAVERLACYDRIARGVNGERAVAPLASAPMASAPVPAAPPIAPSRVPAAPPPQGLGSERLPRAAAPPRNTEEIVRVTSVSFDPRGRFTMTLENGQIWQQVPGDTARLRQRNVSNVRITRGVFASYDLQVVGLNASYKVSRVQ
jgi:hypothetical protein